MREGAFSWIQAPNNSIIELPVGLELYDLATDLGETKNLATARPEVVQDLQSKADAMRAQLGDSLTKRTGNAVRPAGVAPE